MSDDNKSPSEESDQPQQMSDADPTITASEGPASDGDTQEPMRPRIKVTRAPATSRDFFTEVLASRAKDANPKLREQLTGTIKFEIEDRKESYVCDWSGPELKVTDTLDSEPMCQVKLSEDTFMQILKGEINPQIALVSDKMEVSGEASLAVYFFNLLDRRPSV